MEQGAVTLGGTTLRDAEVELAPASLCGCVLQVGKRKFVKFE